MSSLYEKLKKYGESKFCPMHMPGHKRNLDLIVNKLPYNIDITEIYDFDNLHSPEGIIKNIEDKARDLFCSKRSFALVNRKYLWHFGRNRSSSQFRR